MHQRRVSLVFVPLFATVLSVPSSADVTLPRLIGNHMVLQRDRPVPIWGWDNAGQEVTVTLGETKVAATAGKNGKWLVTLPAQKAAGPFTVVIRGSTEVHIKDVLFGEVWVCSGQSNMSWPLKRCIPHEHKEIAGGDLPRFRLIRLPHVMSTRPLGDDPNAVGFSEFGKQRDVREVPLMPRPADRAATLEREGDGWQLCSTVTARHYNAVGYFFGRELVRELDVPIGVINASWGGSKIEPWIPPAGYDSVPALKEISENLDKQLADRINYTKPTVIYNGMIHPLLPYVIRGAIWYQGESNGNEGRSYTHKMQALINGWRAAWKQGDFPFYFVQLPNYLQHGRPGLPADSDPQGGNGWARIREAQARVPGTVKNTGMAVTIDVGQAGDIHPSNKYDVARRLALLALAKEYGQKDVAHSGPIYKSMKVVGGMIELTFDHVGRGLFAARKSPIRAREAGVPLDFLDGLALAGAGAGMPEVEDKLDGFSIAGADQKWHWAEAVIEGDTIIVSSAEVEKPVAVRYGFSANPGRCNLYNRDGLPAAPFRTDSWEYLQYTDHTLSRIVERN